ncbi:unnamed protein product, partial [Adineta steineri]
MAELRKTMIDEMAANHLQIEEKSKLALQSQKDKYQSEVEKFEKEINDLKIKDRTLKQLQYRCTELENRLKSEEELKQVLTLRVEELQTEIYELKNSFETQLSEQQ